MNFEIQNIMKNIRYIFSLLLIGSILIACNKEEEDLSTQKLKGTWIEESNTTNQLLRDTVIFIDNSTVAVRTKYMASKKAYKFLLENDQIVLMYQNSALKWVEGTKCPYEFKDDKLLIYGLSINTIRKNFVTFNKILD